MATAGGDAKHRVKVYELTEDGEWNDRGTGNVQFQVVAVSVFARIQAANVKHE
jgi:hypothetical protein